MPSHSITTAARPVGWPRVTALLLIALLSPTVIGLARTAAADTGADTTQVTPALAALLPHTDGDGLLAAPPAFTKLDLVTLFAAGKDACSVGCATPFGTVLGSADGVPGQSNCAPTCIHPEYSFLDLTTGEVSVHRQDPHDANLRYVGIAYQCVEYARKWWMKNQDITFGDVDGADQIIYLTEGQNIRTQARFALARSINGSATRPPQRGDLVVYYADRRNPNWRFGHVAVVVGVDLGQGSVSLAEENYSNAPWQDQGQYARQIRLFEIGGRYTLIDVPVAEIKNPDGGRIAGWIYPLSPMAPIP